jgi:hypothetical protein
MQPANPFVCCFFSCISQSARCCCVFLGPAQVVESSGLAPVGEVLLVPDLSAAVPWVGQPGDIMAPVDMVERDLSEWQTLPVERKHTLGGVGVVIPCC